MRLDSAIAISKIVVIFGVLHVSYLGPSLFNIFINDFYQGFAGFKCLPFADDLKIFTAVNNTSDFDKLQYDE